MTDLRKAAKQALEALEGIQWPGSPSFVKAAIAAIKEALAQPEQDVPEASCGNMEPVGWLESPDGAFRANPLYKIKFPSKLLSWQVPLYMALPQPEPEPVAKVELMLTGGAAGLATRIVEIDDHLRERLRPGQLLYTAPPQRTWVGLTAEEYIHITDSLYHQGHGLVAYYKAIESKLKEKNT